MTFGSCPTERPDHRMPGARRDGPCGVVEVARRPHGRQVIAGAPGDARASASPYGAGRSPALRSYAPVAPPLFAPLSDVTGGWCRRLARRVWGIP
jgi:hypothetical protein